MITALAPTVGLATPKVEAFVRKIADEYLCGATVKEFYTCDPAVGEVMSADRSEEWLEGNWGARVLCDHFSASDVDNLTHQGKTIIVGDATIHPAGEKIEVRLWLSARVMRY